MRRMSRGGRPGEILELLAAHRESASGETVMDLFNRAERAPKDPLKDQYLGKGSRMSGKLNFGGTVQIDGHVDGEISAEETLILGEGAVVTAQISANTVVIKGQVTGDINTRKRVEICAPGKFYGNIVTPSLVIHEGAIFEGHCSKTAPGRRSNDSEETRFAREEKASSGVLARAASEATKF
jgi:cytoskeletal protein CcmA (bactofilin family)